MGTANTNNVKTINDSVTTAIQSSQNSCTAVCENTFANNTIIISGTTIDGDVDLSLKCSAEALCSQDNSIDASVKNVLKNAVSQTAATSGFPSRLLDANTNIAELTNRTKTTLSQFLSNSCTATSTNLTEGNLIYLTNSQIGGSLVLSQEGNARANCSQTNAAKLSVTNDLSNTAKQSAISSGLFGGLGGIVGLLFVAAIIGVGIYMYSKNKKNTPKPVKAPVKSSGASSLKTQPELPPKPSAMKGKKVASKKVNARGK